MNELVIWLGLLLMLAMIAVPVGAITYGQPDTEPTNVGAMVSTGLPTGGTSAFWYAYPSARVPDGWALHGGLGGHRGRDLLGEL